MEGVTFFMVLGFNDDRDHRLRLGAKGWCWRSDGN
jgi:hypothetical protein